MARRLRIYMKKLQKNDFALPVAGPPLADRGPCTLGKPSRLIPKLFPGFGNMAHTTSLTRIPALGFAVCQPTSPFFCMLDFLRCVRHPNFCSLLYLQRGPDRPKTTFLRDFALKTGSGGVQNPLPKPVLKALP